MSYKDIKPIVTKRTYCLGSVSEKDIYIVTVEDNYGNFCAELPSHNDWWCYCYSIAAWKIGYLPCEKDEDMLLSKIEGVLIDHIPDYQRVLNWGQSCF